MKSLFAAFLLLLARPAAAADPVAAELRRLKEDPRSIARRVLLRAPGARLEAVILRQEGDPPVERFFVFAHAKGKASLIHLHPALSSHAELDALNAQGELPDLFEDRDRWLLYTTESPGVSGPRRFLNASLWRKGRFSPAFRPLPQGEAKDLDGDGKPEFLSWDQPLGQFFAVECRSFRSLAAARRGTVYRWKDSALVDVSADFPKVFQAEDSRLEASIEGHDPRDTSRYGDFLSDAISLYYARERLGRAQDGWGVLTRLLRPGLTDPGPVAACKEKILSDLRWHLEIPDYW